MFLSKEVFAPRRKPERPTAQPIRKTSKNKMH